MKGVVQAGLLRLGSLWPLSLKFLINKMESVIPCQKPRSAFFALFVVMRLTLSRLSPFYCVKNSSTGESGILKHLIYWHLVCTFKMPGTWPRGPLFEHENVRVGFGQTTIFTKKTKKLSIFIRRSQTTGPFTPSTYYCGLPYGVTCCCNLPPSYFNCLILNNLKPEYFVLCFLMCILTIYGI